MTSISGSILKEMWDIVSATYITKRTSYNPGRLHPLLHCQQHPYQEHPAPPLHHFIHTLLLSLRVAPALLLNQPVHHAPPPHRHLCLPVGTPSTLFASILNDSTAVTALTTPLLMSPLLPPPTTPNMSNLLKLINNLILNDNPPKDTSPKSTNPPDTEFIFEPNLSATLDLPPPNSPNPFQPEGPDYGWGDK
ncbi:hypothetical protein JAAARDRAFT_197917 [Jaapia argillacea MUCL 33604]|uniref:Uncharacterized protein n=1 Tax=Jaapia argillacea MUCL 33604 TaxID=933084 RepID=A0A067PNH2_9AGAM|nr:hypothetical protein JAAARDRAFT_197917 [Jaapia argillacea MUCL 33604]